MSNGRTRKHQDPTDGESRGARIKRRMYAIGMTNTDLATEARVDRSTVRRAISDDPRTQESTYERLESTLDRIGYEHGHNGEDEAQAAAGTNLVEFEISGERGVRVVVKGPVQDLEQLRSSVAALVREMRQDPPGLHVAHPDNGTS